MKKGTLYSFRLGDSPNFTIFAIEEHAANWARSYSRRNYEPEITEFTKNLDYNVFVDIGSGFGYHSLLNAELGKKVFSFEAHPIRKGCVEHNLNPYENVKVYGSVGETNQPHEPNAMVVKGKSNIKTVSADNKCNILEILNPHLNDKVLVKIDVEGYEVSVLKEMEYFLARSNFKWLIEFHTKFEPKENIDPFFKEHKETIVKPPVEKNPFNFKMFYEKS